MTAKNLNLLFELVRDHGISVRVPLISHFFLFLPIPAQLSQTFIEADSDWSRLFMPNGVLLKEGDLLKREALADTLEKIANEGPNAFYEVYCNLYARRLAGLISPKIIL